MFAGFFPPGYHQCLIYDPLIERAFCKDFVVQLNRRDFVYPEYPLPQVGYVEKIVPNMWADWKEDSDRELERLFFNDVESASFELDRIIKDKTDHDKCLDILKRSMKQILLFQRELMFSSHKYPLINWEALHIAIEAIQNDPSFPFK